MYKCFLKPLKIVVGVCILTALGVASDIAQLTNFNFIDFLKKHSPLSYYFVIAGTFLLYLALVIIEFVSKKPIHQSVQQERNSGQFITTRNIKNSTIIQIRKNKED